MSQDLVKRKMISIHFKMLLLDEFASLEVEGAREAVMLARYPNILKKGMLFKWKRFARQQRWHLLPKDISKRFKEIPKWWRESQGFLHLE
jgi:hypothetical protein